MQFRVTPSAAQSGIVTVPGDKSISHRAVMLGSIANGQTRVSGFLAGDDCLATLAAMRALGVEARQTGPTAIAIDGVGIHGLTAPADDIDLGNSGTAMRLMAGLLAGQTFDSVLKGDASLSGRPMNRIITPLTQMGAVIESDCDGTPPLQIRGGLKLRAIDYALPMASAQVKSAILLAGLYADGETSVSEPAVTRDHTERMLQAMGVEISAANGLIGLAGGQELKGGDIEVPADLSSAAFIMLAALLSEDADILITNVGINPTRTGVIDILKAMGGDIAIENSRELGREPVADIRVNASNLEGCEVDPALVSLAIDEFPVLFVAAAAASGQTTFSGIGELRVKESDRIAAMASGMRVLGIDVDESDEGAVVHGGRMHGGIIQSHGDHRIAMSFAVAGSIASQPVVVEDVDAVDTSFPGFCDCLSSIGIDISRAEIG